MQCSIKETVAVDVSRSGQKKQMHMPNGKQVSRRMLTQTTGLLWGPLLLLHLTAWELNMWGNKNTSHVCTMCIEDDNSTAVPAKLWGIPRNMGDFSVVCASLLKLCWDQRHRDALIRGQAVSQVSYELGPPTSLPFVCTMSPDPPRNGSANLKRWRCGLWGFRVTLKNVNQHWR